MCATDELNSHQRCLSAHHLSHNLRVCSTNKGAQAMLDNTWANALGSAASLTRNVTAGRAYAYLVQSLPAPVPVSIPCGAKEVMWTYPVVTEGTLHLAHVCRNQSVDRCEHTALQVLSRSPHLQLCHEQICKAREHSSTMSYWRTSGVGRVAAAARTKSLAVALAGAGKATVLELFEACSPGFSAHVVLLADRLSPAKTGTARTRDGRLACGTQPRACGPLKRCAIFAFGAVRCKVVGKAADATGTPAAGHTVPAHKPSAEPCVCTLLCTHVQH